MQEEEEENHVMNEENSTIRIAAVQHRLRRIDEDPIEHVKYIVDLMKHHHASSTKSGQPIDLWVLPELSPIGYSKHTFENYLSNHVLHDTIQNMMQKAAHDLDDSLVCFGCIGRRTDDSMKPTIRQVVVNGSGEVCCTYDKISVCDYGDCNESQYFDKGSNLSSFSCGSFRIGILICADIRNPLLANTLVTSNQHNIDVLIQPSAFSRDCTFYSWKSFRETRAIENSIYFMGINYSGNNFGESSINPPWIDEHNLPTILDCKETCLIAKISRSTLNHVRSKFPYRKRLIDMNEECK